nr:hypothetical protein [Candidatus Baldrarchaeota archaeon]
MGLTLEDSKFLAQKLVEEGLDILDVSSGLCGSQPPELQITCKVTLYLTQKKLRKQPVLL